MLIASFDRIGFSIEVRYAYNTMSLDEHVGGMFVVVMYLVGDLIAYVTAAMVHT